MEIELDNINTVFCSWWWLVFVDCCSQGWTGGNNRKEMNSGFVSALVATHPGLVLFAQISCQSFCFHNLKYLIHFNSSSTPLLLWNHPFLCVKSSAISVGSSSDFQKRWTALGLFWNSRLNWNKGGNILIGKEQMFPCVAVIAVVTTADVTMPTFFGIFGFFLASRLLENVMINRLTILVSCSLAVSEVIRPTRRMICKS